MQFLDNIIQLVRSHNDDDLGDRLNYSYTVMFLLLLAMFSIGNMFVGKPIQCYISSDFEGERGEYIESMCWLQNTYYQSLSDPIPGRAEELGDKEIKYYQWVPYILSIQAFCFFLPYAFWRMVSGKTSINIEVTVDTAIKLAKSYGSDNAPLRNAVVKHIDDLVSFNNTMKLPGIRSLHFCFPQCLRGWHISLAYLVTKMFYVCNSIFQLISLNYILKTDSYFYGIDILRNLIQGDTFKESGHFPLITLCKIDARYLGNNNAYTFQCALPGNLFNEKIFVILWFWYLLLALVNILSFLYWFFNTISSVQQITFVLKYLSINRARMQLKKRGEVKRLLSRQEDKFSLVNNDETNDDDALCNLQLPHGTYKYFVTDYLRPDGVFIIRRLSAHAGDVICINVVADLFKLYMKQFGYNEFGQCSTLKNKEKEKYIGNDEDQTSQTDFKMEIEKNDLPNFVFPD